MKIESEHVEISASNIGKTCYVTLQQPDIINSPAHYTSGEIETIDYIEDKGFNYHLGNVVKYISRAGRKGDLLTDLKKAQWYLNREIERVENEN